MADEQQKDLLAQLRQVVEENAVEMQRKIDAGEGAHMILWTKDLEVQFEHPWDLDVKKLWNHLKGLAHPFRKDRLFALLADETVPVVNKKHEKYKSYKMNLTTLRFFICDKEYSHHLFATTGVLGFAYQVYVTL
ncbi:hypothetical protein TKK_0018893 [Trichogramma kaykai]